MAMGMVSSSAAITHAHASAATALPRATPPFLASAIPLFPIAHLSCSVIFTSPSSTSYLDRQLVKPTISNFSCLRRDRKGCISEIPQLIVLPEAWRRSRRLFLRPVSELHANGDTSTSPAEEKRVQLSRSALLWRSAKVPMYSVVAVPLCVGTAAAFLETRLFSCGQFFLLLLSSFFIMAWLNLSNDAYDAETGVDKEKEESLVNIIGNQSGVLVAAYVCLFLGLFGLAWGAFQAGDVRIVGLLFAAISCGYLYQCPPFRLAYKGLGEPLCFLAFGPFATTAFYLCQAVVRGSGVFQFSKSVIAAAVVIGVTTTLILFCSHFHQIEGDRSSGKNSPLVRLGTESGARVVELAVNSLYLLLAIMGVFKVLPLYAVLFCFLTYPVGQYVRDFVKTNHANKQAISIAKYYCVCLNIAFGIALVLGFLVAASIPTPRLWRT
ncbi:hypothetical protein O6H91_20G042400 [Diphasiastrum complanatum]|uniref:Uncharacterized protein n=2 Tax=Diphasiastrum complanatum TaxID=34168 RepID=A0ACC2AQR5_DIPCM|nr:hypothetical protein O6H91_20G042400 [Diphasiastrum complanatum]KAJ7519513.1 hypothetical protein O6H91_20G042400 [Diphasiastrum complanatum]